MSDSLDRFLDALREVSGFDDNGVDPTDFVRSRADLDNMLSPWATWVLLGLIRHRQRQLWVAEIVRTRLGGDPKALAAMGAMGHPQDVAQAGTVPGMAEWEYYFHGRGCCVTHKVNGDSIDVDFWDDSAEYFDTFFYQSYLTSLRKPQAPERRIRELHTTVSTITIAVDELFASNAIEPLPGKETHPYRLSERVVAASHDAEAFCGMWETPRYRLLLGAAVGDWLAAAGTANPDTANLDTAAFRIAVSRADRVRTRREQRLIGLLNAEFKGADSLRALADLGTNALEQHLCNELTGQPSGKISAALDVVERLDDAKWCEPVYELFSRLNPSDPIPSPRIWIRSLRFLIRHDYRVQTVLPHLSKAAGSEVGEAVLLALEHAPEMALGLIRKALHSTVPICRSEVAAILALVNRPWSKKELLDAIRASDDHERTADARAALLELGDAEADKAVVEWERRNPREEEKGTYLELNGRTVGPLYTFGELSLRHRSSRIQYEMQQLHDRVMKVRRVDPTLDPTLRSTTRWWQFWKRRGH